MEPKNVNIRTYTWWHASPWGFYGSSPGAAPSLATSVEVKAAPGVGFIAMALRHHGGYRLRETVPLDSGPGRKKRGRPEEGSGND